MQDNLWTKGLVIGIILLFFLVSVVPIIKSDPITWDVEISVHETGGSNDNVIFGESTNALDGPPPDVYDVVKPPAPIPPYVRTWLNDNLPTPFDVLWSDFRHYPSTSKVWNVTVQWMPSGSPAPTVITFSWSTAAVNASEYSSVLLCTGTGTPLLNMRTNANYSFTCSPYVPQDFTIKCSSAANQPPTTPNTPSPPDMGTDVPTTTPFSWAGGDPDNGDTVLYDVYFGTTNPPTTKVSANQSATIYNPGTLAYNTQYYWRIVSWDNHGASSSSPLWSFTTQTLTNNPPSVPGVPSGPVSLFTGNIGRYFASTSDSDGDLVQYQFDWNASGSHYYTGWTLLVASGESVNKTRSWLVSGTYVVKVRARDMHGLVSGWSDGLTVTVAFNQAPIVPGVPSGPVDLVAGNTGKYFASTSDSDGDLVQYQFDWNASGSHYYTGWTLLVASGESVNKTRSWLVSGTYVVKVRARDMHGLVSGWSDGLTVVVHS